MGSKENVEIVYDFGASPSPFKNTQWQKLSTKIIRIPISVAMYTAMDQYSSTIRGKAGIVTGSVDPWIEIFPLKLNASHVTTMQSTTIVAKHPKISYETPEKAAKSYQK